VQNRTDIRITGGSLSSASPSLHGRNIFIERRVNII
jgi:hypothetical protein